MSNLTKQWRVWAAVALVCAVSSAARAQSNERISQMESELRNMRAEIARLKGEENSNWLNERRQEEVKALVREVLEDADTRASLAGEGMTAGHNGKHFFLASEDGSFAMEIEGHVQVRYIYNHRNDDDSLNEDGERAHGRIDENESGFQIRRTKLDFTGHIGNPKLTYDVLLAASRKDNSVGLEEVAIGYKFADDLKVEVGRRKLPFLREELTSSKRQLAVERSTLNEVFTLNRSEGIWVKWGDGKQWLVTGAISDGQNAGEIGGGPTGNNDFDKDRTDGPAITARIDLALAGDLKQAGDFTAWSGEPTGIFIGAAIHYEYGEHGDTDEKLFNSDGDFVGTGGINNPNYFSWTVDGSVEMHPLNVYGAFVGSHPMDVLVGNADEERFDRKDFDNYGALIQVGYHVIPDKLEPFVRFEWISLDSGDSGTDEAKILTFGVNYYLNKHNAKFTLDLVWAIDPLTSALEEPFGFGADGVSGGLGLRPDNGNDEDQIAVRAQFQLLF